MPTLPAGFEIETPDQMALPTLPPGFKIVTPVEPTIPEQIVGGLETAGALVSGAVAQPVAGLAGIVQTISPFAEPGAGTRAVKAVSEALSFDPRTTEGKTNLEAIVGSDVVQSIAGALETAETTLGEAGFDIAGPLGGAIGATIPTAILEAMGLGLGALAIRGARPTIEAGKVAARPTAELAKGLFEFQSPTKQRLGRLIASGSTDVDVAKFELAKAANLPKKPTRLQEALDIGGPKVRVDKIATEAIKQGFDEGVIAAIKGSSAADKTRMLDMVDIMERGKKNKRFAVTNRPSDVAGNALMDRFRVIRDANKKAGKELDIVAKTLKGQPIDSTPAISQFVNDLDSMGIRLELDDLGEIKPNFSGSAIEDLSGPENVINRIVKRLSKVKTMDASELHRMKKFIDEQVTFGKTAEGLAGKTEIVLKNLRKNLDDILDASFPEYNRVNTTYSETRSALDSLQDVAGKKMNLTGTNAERAIGTLLRRLMSNAQSRVRLLDSVDQIESVARKYGEGTQKLIEGPGLGREDLLTQILFVDELDSMFGPVARTSFQGQIEQAIKQGTRTATTRVGALESVVNTVARGAEKFRGINEEASFKVIKELLKR